MQDHYRQGDVLIRRITQIPDGCEAQAKDQNRVILAYGEVTGHCHQIDTPDFATLFQAPAAEVEASNGIDLAYLKVDVLSQLVHEEHSAIPLEAGVYRVTRQREYTPERIIQVAD